MTEQVKDFVTWLNEQPADEGHRDIIQSVLNFCTSFPRNCTRRLCMNWLAAHSTRYEYIETINTLFDEYEEYLLRKAGEIGDEARIYCDYPASTPGSTKLDMLED